MASEAAALHEILITGPGAHVASPEWARRFKTRVVAQPGLARLRTLPLITVVRARRPGTLLAHRDFIDLVLRKWRGADEAATLLIEFGQAKEAEPAQIDAYARVLAAFSTIAHIELALGAQHAASALVEAAAKIAARSLRPSFRSEDPLSRARRAVAATGDLRGESGRLAADKVAAAFGLSVAALAATLGEKRQTVSKTPDAPSRQHSLFPFERIARLQAVLSSDDFRKWLRMPNDELGDEAPLDWIRAGKVDDVADLVDDMLSGSPA